MLYKKCAELPLSIFLKIVLESDINLLIKSGEHSPEEVGQAWEEIYSEYFEIAGSMDSKYLIQTARTILIAENKIDIINACVPILRLKENEKCYNALTKIGYPIKRIEDRGQRNKELDRLVSRAKGLVHTIAQGERELRRVTENEGRARPTEQDYIRSLAYLSKFQGYRIDPEITTVAEYVAIQKHFQMTLDDAKQRVHR